MEPYKFRVSGHEWLFQFKSVRAWPNHLVCITETQLLPQEQYSVYKEVLHEISKNLNVRTMTWSKFHIENPQLLGATVQNLVAKETCRPKFVTYSTRNFYITSRQQFESLITYLTLVLAVCTRQRWGSHLFLWTKIGNTRHVQMARSQPIWRCKWISDGIGFSPTSVAATDSFPSSYILDKALLSDGQ
jgi:hypothetical protein